MKKINVHIVLYGTLCNAIIKLDMIINNNPKLLAHDQLYGAVNYNVTALVPPGTTVIILRN